MRNYLIIILFLFTIILFPQSAKEWFNKGKNFLKNKKYNEAINGFSKAIQADFDYTEAYFYRGVTYTRKNNLDLAIKDYTRTIQMKPEYAYAYYSRGNTFFLNKKYNSAIKDYKKAIKIKPNNTKANYNLACIYSSINEDKYKALKYLTNAVKNGFNDLSHISQNTGLEIIKDTVEFNKLIQEMSVNIVKNDKNGENRILAVEKLKDLKLLSNIAKNDSDISVREAAEKRIAILTGKERTIKRNNVTVIFNSTNNKNQKKILNYDDTNGLFLSDQEGLAKKAKNSKDRFVRADSVKKLKSNKWQKLLIEIAKNDKDIIVRRAAVKKILNKKVLKNFIAKDRSESIRNIAKKKLSDLKILKKKKRFSWDEFKIKDFHSKFYDQNIEAEKAKNNKDYNVRANAVYKLDHRKYQHLLENSARNDSSVYVRRVAVEKLTNKEVLRYFATKDADSQIRSIALQKLKDQKLLLEIARKDEDDTVRYTAVQKLIDKNVLNDIAKHDKSGFVKLSAENRLKELKNSKFKNVSSQYSKAIIKQDISKRKNDIEKLDPKIWNDLLIDLAKNDINNDIRSLAIKKLIDQKVLIEIAKKDKEDNVRYNAVQRLIDKNVLSDIAKHDKSGFVRYSAKKRLEELQK